MKFSLVFYRLQEHWVEVNGSTQVQALFDALSSVSSNNESSPSKTLVFANSVEAADAICRILKKTQTECLCYHREMTSEERAKNLKFFEESGGILVCTDSAARGLDIHNVNHVIQVISQDEPCNEVLLLIYWFLLLFLELIKMIWPTSGMRVYLTYMLIILEKKFEFLLYLCIQIIN